MTDILSEYSLFTTKVRILGGKTIGNSIPIKTITEQGIEDGDYVKILIRKITKENE